MKNIPLRGVMAVLLCASACASAAEPPLTPQERADVLRTLSARLEANYVFPEVAAKMALALPGAMAAYPPGASAQDIARGLSRDLRQLGDDRHFRVFVDPDFHEAADPDAVPSAQEMAHQRVDAAQSAFGIERLQRLPGNVGYVELRGFGPPELVGPAYAAALTLLDGSDALILDLRRNGGGDPRSVALWLSHFFPLGDHRHLNDLYTRSTGVTEQSWTQPGVLERYSKPVYVLVSPRTFSGGEECAYDFQTQKRAVLVGQATGGGANAGDRFGLGQGLVVNIPTTRAINPVTHTNWEHVGVKPDIEAPAATAQQVAYVAILRTLSAQAADPDAAQQLRRLAAQAEKGESDPPRYELRQ